MASKIIILIIALFFAPALMAKTYVIQADGMMCQACVETVTDGFQTIDENAKVNVDLEKQTITVNAKDLTEEEAKKIITDRGYNFVSFNPLTN